jgi:hypothetical protein
VTTQFMPRSAWTTASRGGAQLTGAKLVGNALHWPGTPQNVIGDPGAAKIAARLRGYWDFHVNTRGWVDIGYNFAIDQGGRVWDLRGLTRVGAHAASTSNPDANHEWMGVLLILGDEERPSAAMIRAFQDFRFKVFLPRWPGRTRLTGHGRAPGVQGAQTSCCGPFAAAKILDGTLAQPPGTTDPGDDDVELTDKVNNPDESAITVQQGIRGAYLNSIAAAQDSARALARTDLILLALKTLPDVDVDEAALAASLGPLLIPHLPDVVADLDDETIQQIASMVADEQSRRLQA